MKPARRLPSHITFVLTVLVAACQRQGDPAPAVAVTPPAPVAPASIATPAAVPSAASGLESPPAGVLRAYVWRCDDGRTYKIRNLWRERAVAIDLHDGTHKLAQERSASGARYADSSVTFFTKGGEATLDTPGASKVQCHEQRAQSLAEDARMRGVLYRGLGNEPGWTLEIGPGSTLVWVTGYGQERHEIANALATGDVQSGLVYAGMDATGEINVTVRSSPCQDDMSGDGFDLQVTVRSGGRDYRGCGSRL